MGNIELILVVAHSFVGDEHPHVRRLVDGLSALPEFPQNAEKFNSMPPVRPLVFQMVLLSAGFPTDSLSWWGYWLRHGHPPHLQDEGRVPRQNHELLLCRPLSQGKMSNLPLLHGALVLFVCHNAI